MRKSALFLILFTLILTFIAWPVFAEDDMTKIPKCGYCGMDRHQWAHSRMFMTFDDGKEVGTCSIHCLAVDLSLNIDRTPASIQVGDYNTKKLIDAENAYWVIGGEKPGVMTKRAKWAFEKKADAEAYINASGGQLGTFDQAMKATYEDMYSDTQMIRERRKAKRMKMQMQPPAEPKK